MLTLPEKIAFILLTISSLSLSWFTFSTMFKVVGIGNKSINWKLVLLNWPKGLAAFIGQKTLFKTRPVVGFIHALVAWGFTFYLIVNVFDVLYGFIPGFHFFPNYIIGKTYRIFVDIFTVLVLLGVIYFLVRRFITKDYRLEINSPVMLSDEAKIGMKRDSLLVGAFILLHVGSRFLSASFEIAQNKPDWYQPAATMLSMFWAGMDFESLVMFEHISWWLALGLILGFLRLLISSRLALNKG